MAGEPSIYWLRRQSFWTIWEIKEMSGSWRSSIVLHPLFSKWGEWSRNLIIEKRLCLQCWEKSFCVKKGLWTKHTEWRTKSQFLNAVPTCVEQLMLLSWLGYSPHRVETSCHQPTPHQPRRLQAEGRNRAANLLCQVLQDRVSKRHFPPLVEGDIKGQKLAEHSILCLFSPGDINREFSYTQHPQMLKEEHFLSMPFQGRRRGNNFHLTLWWHKSYLTSETTVSGRARTGSHSSWVLLQ